MILTFDMILGLSLILGYNAILAILGKYSILGFWDNRSIGEENNYQGFFLNRGGPYL